MFVRSRHPEYICASCRAQAKRHITSSAVRRTGLITAVPSSGIAKLQSRRLISLQGQDAVKFLQGIVTNNVRIDSNAGFYAAFLTAPGKVLHDVFIYPTVGSRWRAHQSNPEEHGYLVEVDADQAETLYKHLKRHKLRSKFQLRILDAGELDVWNFWREDERWTAHGTAINQVVPHGVLNLTDNRAPGLGIRLLLDHNSRKSLELEVEETPEEAYTVRRYLQGVPEGQKEMPRDDCLPMNCNIDIMGGIDFKKGCYIGQELTIRTRHTGVVRRRVLPILLYPPDEEVPVQLSFSGDAASSAAFIPGTDIKRDNARKRSTGKLIGSIGNVGLGLCRLEQMTDLVISSEGSTFNAADKFMIEEQGGQPYGVKAFVPDWMRGRIREPRIQRRVE